MPKLKQKAPQDKDPSGKVKRRRNCNSFDSSRHVRVKNNNIQDRSSGSSKSIGTGNSNVTVKYFMSEVSNNEGSISTITGGDLEVNFEELSSVMDEEYPGSREKLENALKIVKKRKEEREIDIDVAVSSMPDVFIPGQMLEENNNIGAFMMSMEEGTVDIGKENKDSEIIMGVISDEDICDSPASTEATGGKNV